MMIFRRGELSLPKLVPSLPKDGKGTVVIFILCDEGIEFPSQGFDLCGRWLPSVRGRLGWDYELESPTFFYR